MTHTDEYFIFELSDDEIGIVNRPVDLNYPYAMEIWHDHKGSGSGCNNLRLAAFGRELDLEFTMSRALTAKERAMIIDATASE